MKNVSKLTIEEQRVLASSEFTSPETLTAIANNTKKGDVEMLHIISHNTHTSPEILTKLSENEDIHVKCNVASNPNTPVSVLTVLSKNSNKAIRIIIATNSHTPANILKELSVDPYTWEFITANINTSAELLADIAERTDNIFILRNIAANNKTPILTLLNLLSKDDNTLHYNITSNTTFLDFIKKLTIRLIV